MQASFQTCNLLSLKWWDGILYCQFNGKNIHPILTYLVYSCIIVLKCPKDPWFERMAMVQLTVAGLQYTKVTRMEDYSKYQWELNYEKYITSSYLVQDVFSVPICPGIQQN